MGEKQTTARKERTRRDIEIELRDARSRLESCGEYSQLVRQYQNLVEAHTSKVGKVYTEYNLTCILLGLLEDTNPMGSEDMSMVKMWLTSHGMYKHLLCSVRNQQHEDFKVLQKHQEGCGEMFAMAVDVQEQISQWEERYGVTALQTELEGL